MMEQGFYHPHLGYWQTTSVPTKDIQESYPAGTVNVPLKPGSDYIMKNGEWVHTPISPDPVIVVVPAVTLWERMSEDEAVQVEAAMSTQPFRTRQIFMTAQTFRSDHELWPLLEAMAKELFGEQRAADLLS